MQLFRWLSVPASVLHSENDSQERFRFYSFPEYSAAGRCGHRPLQTYMKKQTGQTTMSALTNMLHHRRIRRWPAISTVVCFTIPLRSNCSRWERCLHAGGAVVQLCREIPVCWPQRSSTGYFCGTAVQSDPRPAPLFAHFFWQGRKSGSAKQPLRCCRTNGSSGANRKRRADRGVRPLRSARQNRCRRQSGPAANPPRAGGK